MTRQLLTITAPIAAATILSTLLAPTVTRADEADPKVLFVDTHKCNTCHSVAAVEIVAKSKSATMKGPDLSGYVAEDIAELEAYLRKEEDREGESHKKAFKGSDEELQAVVDWLGTLEAADGE